MNTTAEVKSFDIERDWLDGLKAINEQYDEAEGARKKWLRIGRGLLAGRMKCPANRDYGEWLNTTGYRVIKDDERQDAVWLTLNAEIVMPILAETRIGNPCRARRYIREALPPIYTGCQEILAMFVGMGDAFPKEILAAFTDVSVDEKLRHQSAENDAAASTAPIASLPGPPQVTQVSATPRRRHPILNTNRGERRPIKNLSNMALAKAFQLSAEDTEVLLSAYPIHRQKFLSAEIMKLHANHKLRRRAGDLVRLAVKVAKDGDAPDLTDNKVLDARMFWPHLPNGFCAYRDLSAPNLARHFDRLTLVNAKAAEMDARGAPLPDIITEITHLWTHGTERPKPVAKPVVIPAHSRIKHEVKFCGETIWPAYDLKEVTDDDLNTGWHLVHYWISHLETAKPQKPNEVAVQLAHLIADIGQASSKEGLVAVMNKCLSAFLKVNSGAAQADLSNSMAPGLKI